MVALKESARRPAIFFDRDGVLNHHDEGYVFKIEKFRWIEGAREAVKAVNNAGFWAFVVTNQSGIARGYYEEKDVQTLHKWMNDDLATIGARIDAFEYCPFHPDGIIEEFRSASDRRKPAPGMINDLLRRFSVDEANSLLIGDNLSDIEAAEAAGLQSILFSGGNVKTIVDIWLAGKVNSTKDAFR
ncbi:D,D-heptose 1,7-bisphosphate phosphatase [Bradyrhizobium sp. LM2.7]